MSFPTRMAVLSLLLFLPVAAEVPLASLSLKDLLRPGTAVIHRGQSGTTFTFDGTLRGPNIPLYAGDWVETRQWSLFDCKIELEGATVPFQNDGRYHVLAPSLPAGNRLATLLRAFFGTDNRALETMRGQAVSTLSKGEGQGGGEFRPVAVPLPGFHADLLPGQDTLFRWSTRPTASGSFEVRDAAGKVVFECPVRNQASLRLTPEQMGLRTGLRYVWRVEGASGERPLGLSLLDPERAGAITRDLRDIWAAPVPPPPQGAKAGSGKVGSVHPRPPVSAVIVQALYLQLLTDTDPVNLNLSWLASQILEDLPGEERHAWVEEVEALEAMLSQQYGTQEMRAREGGR